MVEVLKAFSYYHPDNGYLQGMNYLCENILKLTDDTYTCYSIFENLMNNQYYHLYTGNFDGLKIKIYQFMRILQRERPELYDHLRAEKLEGEHFLLSWAITLWGEMCGDLCWVLWDGFVLRGWDWWFRTTLWLLKVLEPELLKMNF
jgi:ecotropic viral integration site 5 protein